MLVQRGEVGLVAVLKVSHVVLLYRLQVQTGSDVNEPPLINCGGVKHFFCDAL